jgi:hypothetical protein
MMPTTMRALALVRPYRNSSFQQQQLPAAAASSTAPPRIRQSLDPVPHAVRMWSFFAFVAYKALGRCQGHSRLARALPGCATTTRAAQPKEARCPAAAEADRGIAGDGMFASFSGWIA